MKAKMSVKAGNGEQIQTPGLRKRKWENSIFSWLLILPAMFFLIVFVVYPAIDMVYMSFFKGNAVNPYKEFIGFKNYYNLFFVKDDFLFTLKNTTAYTLGALCCTLVLSVLLAQWLSDSRKLNSIAQKFFYMPQLVAAVSASFVWSWLMSSESYGLFNTVLGWFGFPNVKWLDDSDTAMLSIIIMNTWKSLGYYALIILSSMKSIPNEIYEAARLDNASKSKIFFKITLLMISPQLFFILITITTGSFKVFDSVRIMTNGGPGNSTRVLSMYIYDYAFQRNNTLGYACASGTVMMIILIVVTWIYFGFIEKRVHYK